MLDFLRLEEGDRVLEIGPGGGVLTHELLATGARVLALEIDPAWAFGLPKSAKTFLDRDSATAQERAETEAEKGEKTGTETETGTKTKTKKLRLGERRKTLGPESPSDAEQPAPPHPAQRRALRGESPTIETGVFPFTESLSFAFRSSDLRLSVLLADALEFSWERLDADWKIVGNLPYNVGTAILERFLAGARPGTRAAFLLQREVVDRIVARPGDDAYGALSVLVAARARAVRLGVVKPGAFVPPPKVDSAFVGLEAIAPPLPGADMPGLEGVIKLAFGQRRKSLRNALAAAFGRELSASVLEKAGIDSRRRAEELGLDEFVRLSSCLTAE